MRYIAVEWMGEKPEKREIYRHLVRVLGEIALAQARFGFVDDYIACDRKWVDKVRGALALRWQFRVLGISGTLKGLERRLNKQ